MSYVDGYVLQWKLFPTSPQTEPSLIPRRSSPIRLLILGGPGVRCPYAHLVAPTMRW